MCNIDSFYFTDVQNLSVNVQNLSVKKLCIWLLPDDCVYLKHAAEKLTLL